MRVRPGERQCPAQLQSLRSLYCAPLFTSVNVTNEAKGDFLDLTVGLSIVELSGNPLSCLVPQFNIPNSYSTESDQQLPSWFTDP